MRTAFLGISLVIFSLLSFAQNKQHDSLKSISAVSGNDTSRVNTQIEISNKYGSIDPDSTIYYSIMAKDPGDYQQAIKYHTEAYKRAKSNNAGLEMTQALNSLAETYMAKGDFIKAISTYKEVEALNAGSGSGYDLKSAYEGLAKSYEQIKDFKNAYKYEKLYTIRKDSLYSTETDKKIQLLKQNLDMEKQQHDIDLLTKDIVLQNLSLRQQKIAIYAAGSIGLLLLLLAIGLFSRYKYIRKTKKIIEKERDRSEKLLLNILPGETAQELKEKGSATPKHYKKVSVLFTDFKGFTRIKLLFF
jgi:adenylate cyclase